MRIAPEAADDRRVFVRPLELPWLAGVLRQACEQRDRSLLHRLILGVFERQIQEHAFVSIESCVATCVDDGNGRLER